MSCFYIFSSSFLVDSCQYGILLEKSVSVKYMGMMRLTMWIESDYVNNTEPSRWVSMGHSEVQEWTGFQQ